MSAADALVGTTVSTGCGERSENGTTIADLVDNPLDVACRAAVCFFLPGGAVDR